ncbi:pre-peptidase C-terminal domain-containing protein [Simiduia agarivorans]|uniref:Cold-active alkaline serine protease n=1 Tax=Simiduia agarivorans (strain DSM 21679 / JCM 13881 / BCRC 17597 / SA1) TaxID=1117647 RepID=K4KID1_SIMAS|nr:pre-peptidase C-terminal domain-containing protein [Simiduia agarivorans]AFU97965.1 cold-active alkaline serine protease [Simiduia agarivorans SA1 = DSM 21679]
MKYPVRKIAAAVTASVLGVALSSQAAAQNETQAMSLNNAASNAVANDGSHLPKRYIVKYKNTNPNAAMAGAGFASFSERDLAKAKDKLLAKGAKIKLKMSQAAAFAAEMSAQSAAELAMDPSVEYVEEDVPRKFMALYNDDVGNPTQMQLTPYAVYQSQANQLALQSGQKVCVIDSGIAGSNGETGGLNNDFDWNSITGDNDSGTGNWYADGGPHGTHVAGTVGAVDNGFGVVGMAPGVPMHIIKVFNDAGWGYSSDLAQAANLCAAAGANIITMSLGGGAANTTEENAFKNFTQNGGLVLAAAGNDGNSVRSYPAGYDSVMMVGANDANDVIADFSQFPSCNTAKTNCVEVTAGGVNTLSTYPSGGATLPVLTADGISYSSSAFENVGSASGSLYFMGTAETTHSAASGKVCLIDRGNISFHDKVKNCQNSGGIGAIIVNNVAGTLSGTLGDTNTTSIPAVGAAFEDRAALMASGSATVSVESGDYGYMSGTSMATPAVAGVAALVWSNHPACTGTQIRNALKATAQDSGAAGHDVYFGNGIVKAKAASDYLTTFGCDGDTGGGNGGGGDTALENGVAKTGLSAATGGELRYTLEVPAGASNLNFAMSGGSGDADLYVRFGSEPTTSTYDCRPYKTGNAETCAISNVQAGTYHVMVRAYSSFSGVSLTGSYDDSTGGGGGNGGAGSAEVTDVSGARRSWTHYTVEIPAGMSVLNINMAGGTGDADMYVRYGAQPTSSAYDCRPYKSGNAESCVMNNPTAGTWHISIYGYRAYSGVSLNLDWQ